MTYRTVSNATDFTSKKHCISQTFETQRDNTVEQENSPNNVNNTGAPLVYKAREHRPVGTLQNGNLAPVFNGPIPDLELTQNVLMTPVDYSVYFIGAATYTLTVTPSGLSFDTNTGILSGTPDTISGTNPIIAGVNANGSTNSNSFQIDVVSA